MRKQALGRKVTCLRSHSYWIKNLKIILTRGYVREKKGVGREREKQTVLILTRIKP